MVDQDTSIVDSPGLNSLYIITFNDRLEKIACYDTADPQDGYSDKITVYESRWLSCTERSLDSCIALIVTMMLGLRLWLVGVRL